MNLTGEVVGLFFLEVSGAFALEESILACLNKFEKEHFLIFIILISSNFFPRWSYAPSACCPGLKSLIFCPNRNHSVILNCGCLGLFKLPKK